MVNFEYYINEYNGQKIQDEKKFLDYEKIALKYVLKSTDNRGTINDIGEAVCAVCDALFEMNDTEGIKSETIDGISVNYEDKRFQKRIHNTLKLFLPTRLLYRGI